MPQLRLAMMMPMAPGVTAKKRKKNTRVTAVRGMCAMPKLAAGFTKTWPQKRKCLTLVRPIGRSTTPIEVLLLIQRVMVGRVQPTVPVPAPITKLRLQVELL